MPPIAGHNEHQWTKFELNTMLALMARGIHLDEKPSSTSKKGKYTSTSTSNAYLNFATELNHALHGDKYQEDISKREVTKMLDKMLKEKKQVVGRGGLMERQRTGRITRFLRLAWESNRRGGFDGSLTEWNSGRRERELGLAPATQPAVAPEVAPSAARVQKRPGRNSAVVSARSRYKSGAVVLSSDEEDSDVEPARTSTYTDKLVPASRGYDSYLHYHCPSASSPRHVSTPEKAQIEDSEIATPGLTNDNSSPEKDISISSPEKRDSEGVIVANMMHDKDGDGDVEMADEDRMARELEEMFGVAESGF